MATAATAATASTGLFASSSSTSAKSIASNFDQFLLLLTTQLKNQSPLDPLDTNQFTQQLVQFASVEQQLKTNDTLSALLSLTKATTTTNALGYVGATVTADGSTSVLKNGRAEWALDAPRAGQATLTVKDKNGNVVATSTQTLTAGQQSFIWNGRTSTGGQAADGNYSLTIAARDGAGSAMSVGTEFTGVVDSVDVSGDTPTLRIGGLSVPIEKVKFISRE